MQNKFIVVIISLGLTISCSQKKDSRNVSISDVPSGMVIIPEGLFTMGGKSEQSEPDEFPRHDVTVSAFYMDIAEVSNAQFSEFIEATSYITVAERDVDWEEIKGQLPPETPKPPDSVLRAGSLIFKPTEGPVNLRNYSQWWNWTVGADWQHPDGPESDLEGVMGHPVVHIAWEDAIAYADWASKRLPTEAEWEWASMGGLDDVKYPWGNDAVEQSFNKANFWQGLFPYQNLEKDGFIGSAPVKSFPPNGYGLYDMAGNVWEWCQDKYHVAAYQEDAQKENVTNPKGPRESFDPQEPYTPKYVIRGGSFLCNDSYCSGYRVARRMKSSKDSGFNHTGFRCVKDL